MFRCLGVLGLGEMREEGGGSGGRRGSANPLIRG